MKPKMSMTFARHTILVVGLAIIAVLLAVNSEVHANPVLPATITCLSPNGGFNIDGAGFYILNQGESMQITVRPEGSVVSLWSCGWDNPPPHGCNMLPYTVLPGSSWQIVVQEPAPRIVMELVVPTLDCVGFEPPMASGTVTARGNRALPLKAQLVDADGYEMTDLELVAPPVLQVMFQAASGAGAVDVTDDALPAGFGTEGNEFEYNLSDQVWQYNLKTKDHTAEGTYTITMVSGDDSEYIIDPTCVAAFERLE